jgi:hypothetical protein
MSTDTKIVEGNTLIHDWMGVKRMKPPFEHEWIGQQKAEDLRYHTSWDWLMPVVEKINKMDKMVCINLFSKGENYACETKIYNWELGAEEQEHECQSAIESVYNAVLKEIEYIKTLATPPHQKDKI